MNKRYGKHNGDAIVKLRQLKDQKLETVKEIRFQLDLFYLHLDQGKKLCRKLQKMVRFKLHWLWERDLWLTAVLTLIPTQPYPAVQVQKQRGRSGMVVEADSNILRNSLYANTIQTE